MSLKIIFYVTVFMCFVGCSRDSHIGNAWSEKKLEKIQCLTSGLDEIRCIDFNNQYLVLGWHSGKVSVYCNSSGKQLWSAIVHPNAVSDVCINDKKGVVLSLCHHGSIIVSLIKDGSNILSDYSTQPSIIMGLVNINTPLFENVCCDETGNLFAISKLGYEMFGVELLTYDGVQRKTHVFSEINPLKNNNYLLYSQSRYLGLSNNILVVQTRSAQVQVIDIFTGRTLWYYQAELPKPKTNIEKLMGGERKSLDKNVSYCGSVNRLAIIERQCLKVFDSQNGQLVWQYFFTPIEDSFCIQNAVIFSPKGRYLAACLPDGKIYVWCVLNWGYRNSNPPYSFKWHCDSIAFGKDESSLKLIDLHNQAIYEWIFDDNPFQQQVSGQR